jgi:hypothetical protein
MKCAFRDSSHSSGTQTVRNHSPSNNIVPASASKEVSLFEPQLEQCHSTPAKMNIEHPLSFRTEAAADSFVTNNPPRTLRELLL